MKVIKGYLFASVVVTAIFVLISCADNLEKLTSLDNLIRIEFSDCSSCYECLDLFSCPYGAIKIDSTHIAQRAYIDTDLCVQCMDCINLFQCPEFAFKRNPDTIPPAPITELSGVSFHVGRLDIQFISTGDDSTKGITYKYDFFLTDSAGDTLEIDYEAPNPGITGYWEYWPPIFNLPSEDLSIHITALDEVGNRSAEAVATASIYENIAPAAIVDLEMENVLADGFTLTWSAVGDDGHTGTADHYIIKIHTEPITSSNWFEIEEIPNSLIPLPAGEIQFFLINDLSENTLYFAAVKTIDEWNNVSSLSNVVQGTTLAIPDYIPPAPINDLIVLTNSINDNSFSLQWTATGDDDLLGNAVYYIIKIHDSNIDDYNWDFLVEYPQNMIPAASGQIENLIITDLTPATEYFAGIKAVDDALNISGLSNIASAFTYEIPDTDPPSSITDLVAEGTETTIELSWTAPGDDGNEGICNHYEIRIHTVEITPNNWNYAQILPEPPTPLIAGSMQSYSVDDLEQMQNYFFAIKAFDESGNESEISNSPMATLIQDITPPATISDLNVVAGYTPNLSTIKIQWTAPGDDGSIGLCDGYQIRYAIFPIDESTWSFAEIFDNPPNPLPAGSQQNCSITGLNPATIYYFAVKAIDDAGNESSVSNSPAGKLVYQINTNACHNCNNCLFDCSNGAIFQGPGYKYIDPDLCNACGDCSCPWNLIYRAVVAY